MSEPLEVIQEEKIVLLKEDVLVNTKKRKIGEVIIRKEIETHFIQVPVRREKIVIEQVNPEAKQLAEINLGSDSELMSELSNNEDSPQEYTLKGKFSSLQIAKHILEIICRQQPQSAAEINLEIVFKDPKVKEVYQRVFNLYTDKNSS